MPCSPVGVWLVRLSVALSLVLAVGAPAARAEPPEPLQKNTTSSGIVQGVVTTQGSIPLGGVLATLRDDTGEVASIASDGDGKFRFEGVKPGRYSVVAALQGFDTLTSTVTVTADQTIDLTLDLRIAVMTDRVDRAAGSAAGGRRRIDRQGSDRWRAGS